MPQIRFEIGVSFASVHNYIAVIPIVTFVLLIHLYRASRPLRPYVLNAARGSAHA